MLQPFERFRANYITRLIELNKSILVTQTYSRTRKIIGENEKVSILLSDYDDMGLAKIHYKAVIRDQYAAILDLSKPVHKAKLQEMLDPASPYDLFWSVVKSKQELEQKINAIYKDKMRDYIANNTTWRIDRDTTVRPSVQMIFGELFIVIKYGKQVIRIKFEELENA